MVYSLKVRDKVRVNTYNQEYNKLHLLWQIFFFLNQFLFGMLSYKTHEKIRHTNHKYLKINVAVGYWYSELNNQEKVSEQ